MVGWGGGGGGGVGWGGGRRVRAGRVMIVIYASFSIKCLP